MLRTAKNKTDQAERPKLFGLWIENRIVKVTVATPIEAGRYRLEIDTIQCPDECGWLKKNRVAEFSSAVSELAERHEMRRGVVAVSLDGGVCVSRITLGSSEVVDGELATLANRVPRYLQLGPGAKVTGRFRERVDGQTDYAVTSVVNQSLMRMIYDALRACEIEVVWAEPSLVSIARLVGQTSFSDDHPLLIADGTGGQWDVGIVHAGRLILDYRPASGSSVAALRGAIDGHIARLHRYCHRHLGIHVGTLGSLMICGNSEKVNDAVEQFRSSSEIKTTALRVPKLDHLYEISDEQRTTHCVPAIATVLPLMLGVAVENVPDLLSEVRRAPDLTLFSRIVRTAWPMVLAASLLIASFMVLHYERGRVAKLRDGKPGAKATVVATQAKMNKLANDRELLNYFQSIEDQCAEPGWTVQLRQITQSLPDVTRLTEFRVESGSEIRLEGTVLDELMVYELLEYLQKLPDIAQVALHSTAPEPNATGTRFVIRLTIRSQALVHAWGGNIND